MTREELMNEIATESEVTPLPKRWREIVTAVYDYLAAPAEKET